MAQLIKDKVSWVCECGTMNAPAFKYCQNCNKEKAKEGVIFGKFTKQGFLDHMRSVQNYQKTGKGAITDGVGIIDGKSGMIILI